MSVTGILIWLGGGQPAETADGYERTGYLVTGAGVALFALVAGAVTATAMGAADQPPAAVAAIGLAAGVLAGLLGRALAGAETTARPDRPAGTVNLPAVAARVGSAVLAGVVVAEMAVTVLFGGTVDRILDDRAADAVALAPAVRTAQDELDRAVADRTALDATIASATTDIDNALIIARCEFNPTAQCPQTKITGVPGRGPEAQTANEMLDDARTALDAAQQRVAPLDQHVTDTRLALHNARAAVADGDRGFGARWSAIHEYTTGQMGASALRLLTWAVFALLALLPLVLRWWRGETAQERRRAAEAVRDRAERAADAAIAEKAASVRADTAAVRAEQQLTAAKLEAEADTTIDRERQRTRVIAALGGLEIGVTERDPESAALPPARDNALPPGEPDLPVPLGKEIAIRQPAGLELPLIGTIPFTDTAARWIRPLVPDFVSSAIDTAIDTASQPLRTARHVLTEAEEITFTLRRVRKVTVDSDIDGPRSIRHPSTGHRDDMVDAEITLDSDAIVSATTHLEPATTAALPTGSVAAESGPRELPPGS
ncbi:membrane protein [Nocardia jinanensis]|uniref:Membrane protein n=2 Tax=Nocardia jinanensis TaxID=382504 RepID=A0A917RSW1_9NOCA|nr:membrane protein [Nocardia jinanensis]